LLLPNNRQLFDKEKMVSDTLKKIPAFILKILVLVGLLVFLAVPAPAQEQQGAKVQTPPPAAPPAKPRAMRRMKAPPDQEEYKYQEEQSRKNMETIQLKKGTGKVGGQEIRAKEGAEDK
jgi:hypothetical protein